jgi:hypothetical protein
MPAAVDACVRIDTGVRIVKIPGKFRVQKLRLAKCICHNISYIVVIKY